MERYQERGKILTNEVFSHDLQTAIMAGESDTIRTAIEQQPINEVIEGIGNRLLARDFLVSEKHHLSLYDQQLDEEVSLEAVTRQCFTAIDSDLVTAFARDEKLRRRPGGAAGERFRNLFTEGSSDEVCVALLRHLSQVQASSMISLRHPYRFMEYMRNAAVESLWEVVQQHREQGGGVVDVRTVAHERVARLLGDIDQRIIGLLFK